MKRTSLLISCCMFLVFSIIITSCEKEGPAGPAGAAGPAGPAGPAGEKGDSGTANVIYSDWLDVEFDVNIDSATGDTLSYVGVIDAPKLDAGMLANGEVKIYLNQGTADDPFISPLPYFQNGIIINPKFVLEQMILISNIDGSTEDTDEGKVWQYRYILIPGGTPARLAIDWNDYKQVKKYLRLKN